MFTLKKFLISLISASLLSCSTITSNDNQITSEDASYEDLEALSTTKVGGVDSLLCVSLPTGGDSEIVKIQDLKTKELISLPVPGTVQGMSPDIEKNIIYVSSKNADGTYYSLYKLDIKSRKVDRILSFSQLGLKPADFIVDDNNVLVTGKRSGVGTFYGNDLIKNEWYSIASNINSGKLEYGFKQDVFHVISFDEKYVTRTIVNVKTKQIVARKTITHDIPFGNNVFIPSPHGSYVYVLHQLNNSFIPYAFNLKQGTFQKFDPVQTDGGLLYGATVSKDGKQLFANVNREIFHYKLEGEKLITLPKIALPTPESRNMAMSSDNKTLYVTHESGTNLSIVKFSNDLNKYEVIPMNIGGNSSEIFIF